jgi:hypothetical protein
LRRFSALLSPKLLTFFALYCSRSGPQKTQRPELIRPCVNFIRPRFFVGRRRPTVAFPFRSVSNKRGPDLFLGFEKLLLREFFCFWAVK